MVIVKWVVILTLVLICFNVNKVSRNGLTGQIFVAVALAIERCAASSLNDKKATIPWHAAKFSWGNEDGSQGDMMARARQCASRVLATQTAFKDVHSYSYSADRGGQVLQRQFVVLVSYLLVVGGGSAFL